MAKDSTSAALLVSRRAVISAGVAAIAPAAFAAAPPKVALLGDSITAGYGLPAKDALPQQLQAQLGRMGVRAQVVGAGRSGDTTAGGVARVDRAVPNDARLCVVALGGNDLLMGAAPVTVRRNLDAILQRLEARRIRTVLAGVQVPPFLGGGYAREFNGAFAGAARAHRVLFLPDLLAGVALNPRLNQADGIHPNAAGVAVIARRLAPLVAQGLAAG